MRVKNLQEFTSAMNALAAEVPQKHLAMQKTLAAEAYQVAVEISPVWSGAYVNEHVVEANGEVVYESGDRVADNSIELEFGDLERPDTSEVHGAMASADAEPFGVISLSNDRFYSNSVEFLHNVYELTTQAIEQEAGAQVLALGGDSADTGEDIPF